MEAEGGGARGRGRGGRGGGGVLADAEVAVLATRRTREIGRASCRERV